ncbi:RNA-binding domain-containing protein, partial [Rozella allomycis CSF55]
MSVKLYIGGLAYKTDTEGLRSKFEEFGEVEDAVVISDRDSGRSRGFGFVTYTNEDDAANAIKEMNDQEFDGRRLRVDRAGERSERRDGNRRGGREGGFGSRGGYRREGGSRYGNDRGYERRGRDEDRGYRSRDRD